jgi:polyribonucleotide nucleotidyltransferase
MSEDRGIHTHTNVNKPEKGPALDFMIFLNKAIENSLSSNGILKKIEDQIGELKMFFQYDFTIPDLNGYVLHIKSEDIKKKRDASQNLLEFIVKNNLDEPDEEGKKQTERISVLIMVPNGLISMIIGTKGRQISNLIKDSGANIVVNQPIYKMLHRTVAISGKPSYVANAIMMIQAIMEDRFYEVSKIEMEFKPLNVTTTQTHVNIIINI